jgi:flagellar basal body P-ring formation protein FlgA
MAPFLPLPQFRRAPKPFPNPLSLTHPQTESVKRAGIRRWSRTAWHNVYLLNISALLLTAGILTASPSPLPSHPDLISVPALHLLPLATADSHGIHLHQVISSSMPLPLPNPRLATAPRPGQTIILSRQQVHELIRQHLPELTHATWTGAHQIQISRLSRLLDETELKDLLTRAIADHHPKERGELELRFPRPWTTIPIPDEPLTLRILDLPATGITPFFIARFELLASSERVGHWQLPLQARLWSDVLIARSPLRRGQRLVDADLETDRRDILTLREALAQDARYDSTLELLVHVQPSQPILNRSVRQRPLILRGHQIPATIQNGALSISLKVEALEDGHAGQIVRVRNPQTRREFTGTVQHEQSILIQL